jgi:hypothetical protein
MAKQKIEIVLDDETGQMMVGAAMENQGQKDFAIKMLISAIKIIIDFQKPVIERATAMPGGLSTKIPLKVTH